MDRLEAMAILLQVAAKGSFSAAARTMRIPVTTVTRKISDLEALIGTKLLIRTTRRVELTDAGVSYVSAAREIIDRVEAAEREASGEFTAPKGELVVTAPVQFGQLHVLPVVCDFLALYPEINIRLLLLDRNVRLVDDHVDLAVRIGPLPDSTMIATNIGSMRTVICASPNLIEDGSAVTTPGQLSEIPCITFDGPLPSPGWTFRDPMTGVPIQVPIISRLSVTTVEAALIAATAGVGAARLLHYQVAEAISSGKLRLLLEDSEPEPAPVSMVHAERGQLPLKIRRFLDYAAPRLREAIQKAVAVGVA